MFFPGESNITVHLIILCIGAAQGLLLAGALIHLGRTTNRANVMLGLTILFYSLTLVDDILFESRLLLIYPFLSDVFSLFIFLVAPAFYLYVRSLTEDRRLLKWVDILHAIPFLLFLILSIPGYLDDDATKLRMVERLYGSGDRFYFNALVIIPLVQVLAYVAAVGWLLLQHSKRVRLEFSTFDKVGLRWIRNLLLIVALLWTGWLVSYFMEWRAGLQVLDLAYTLFVYAFGYLGWRQRMIPTALESPEKPERSEPYQTRTKYAKSGLTESQREALRNRLAVHMTKEKPFLNAELTLTELATNLDTLPYLLSQFLNEELGLTSYEYVNGHRVEEAKRLLEQADAAPPKILAVALDSGFSSKSAFNAAFRKVTGMTPTEYRSRQNQP